MVAVSMEKVNIPNLKKGRKITDYDIDRIDGYYIFVNDNKKQGVLYLDGKNNNVKCIIKPDTYLSISNFDQNGCAIAEDKWNKYLIDNNGQILSKKDYHTIELIYQNLYICHNEFNRNNDDIIDSHGNLICENILTPRMFGKNLFFWRTTGNSSYYSLLDKKIYDQDFMVIEFMKDKVIISHKGLRGVINDRLEKVLDCKYKDIKIINNTHFLVKTKFNWKIIDNYGNTIKKLPELNKKELFPIGHFNDGIIILENNEGLKCLMNEKGEILTQIEYQFFKPFHNGLAIAAQLDFGYQQLVNKEGKKASNVYKQINYVCKDRYIVVRYTDSYALIDTNEYCYARYNYLEKMTDEFIIFQKAQKKGLINLDGEEVLDAKYDEINYQKENNLVFAHKEESTDLYQIKDNHLEFIVSSVISKDNISCKDNLILLKLTNEYLLINRLTHDTIKFFAKSCHIVNNDYIIVNNVLINMKDMDIIYQLDCYQNGDRYSRRFDSEDKRNQIYQEFKRLIENNMALNDFQKVEKDLPKVKKK